MEPFLNIAVFFLGLLLFPFFFSFFYLIFYQTFKKKNKKKNVRTSRDVTKCEGVLCRISISANCLENVLTTGKRGPRGAARAAK